MKPWLKGSSSRVYWLITCAGFLFLVQMLWRSRFCLSVVAGGSMEPTLATGDLLLVNKRAYSERAIQRGDIVMARYNDEYVIKRIVGLPHEELEVIGGTLFVNGARIIEPYVNKATTFNLDKGRLLTGKFAALGDNRSIPSYLAIHPILTKGEIVGKVSFYLRCPRIWNFKRR
jgi:signal peptidase I